MVKITFEQFKKFFDEVIKGASCELCSSSKWAVNDQNKFTDSLQQGKILVNIPDNQNNNFSFYEGLVVYCQKCGNTKFIMSQSVENWLGQEG